MNHDTPIYSTLADDPILHEIVEMFISELPDRVDTLIAQAQAADWQGLYRTAHQLKGALGSHGLGQLTQAAMKLENALRGDEPRDHVQDALEELIGLCRCVQAGCP
jgi:HPt (histidine-containing phosphotransfer) domain-containing protein